MQTENKSIPERVDFELKKLEKRHKAGLENTDLYNLKTENLKLIKETSRIGSQEWKKEKNR